jgi:hypothetical protein
VLVETRDSRATNGCHKAFSAHCGKCALPCLSLSHTHTQAQAHTRARARSLSLSLSVCGTTVHNLARTDAVSVNISFPCAAQLHRRRCITYIDDDTNKEIAGVQNAGGTPYSQLYAYYTCYKYTEGQFLSLGMLTAHSHMAAS